MIWSGKVDPRLADALQESPGLGSLDKIKDLVDALLGWVLGVLIRQDMNSPFEGPKFVPGESYHQRFRGDSIPHSLQGLDSFLIERQGQGEFPSLFMTLAETEAGLHEDVLVGMLPADLIGRLIESYRLFDVHLVEI